MEITLREEAPADTRAVEELTREAFWNVYGPGCSEHYLLHVMRKSSAFIKELDIVAESENKIVGNIVYTKAKILTDSGEDFEVISFGPLSVLPDFRGRGIGGMLIERTKKLAKDLGYSAIFIYGDPEYYKRFSFRPAEYYKIGTSDNRYAAALLAFELKEGALEKIHGRFLEDKIYDIHEEEVEKFDKRFSKKEQRSDLPSQARFRELLGMSKKGYSAL